jgi:hypothetical protein
MSDHNPAYVKIAEVFAGHSFVNHGKRGYARDEIYNSIAESFNSLLARAKIRVFHYLSKNPTLRQVEEVTFRCNQRVPVERVTKKGQKMTVMKSLRVIGKIASGSIRVIA